MATLDLPRADGTDVRHQAALWLLELQAAGDDPELRARWQHWHDASAEHRQAWARVEAFSASLRGMPSAPAHAALAPAQSRRRALKTLGVLLAAGGGIWIAAGHGRLPILLAGERTVAGERRRITLADGSVVDLNADSALDIEFDAAVRRLVLRSGEIHIATAADAARRPFFVDTPQGRALALGTRFTVRTDGAGSHVAVYAGAVALSPRQAGAAAPLVLSAGQQASFTGHAAGPAAAASETDAAWTRGILVAEDMPLPAFVARLAQQTGRSLHCDPSLAALKVSGTYPLADPEAVLKLLANALPIKVERQHGWWGQMRYVVTPA